MTEDGSQWIQLSREDFVDGIKRLKPGRMLKSFLLRELQIGFIDGEVIFAVEGASTSRPAKGQWDGFVCLGKPCKTTPSSMPAVSLEWHTSAHETKPT